MLRFKSDSKELKELYEEWKQTIYSNIRKMLVKEKERYANTLDYCTPQRLNGEIYGYTLKDPYTIEEIEKYEKDIDERLPEDLREYLLYVSRELKTYAYPYEFKLYTDIGKCILPLDETYFSNDEIYELTNIAENNTWQDRESTNYSDDTAGMLKIGEGGCSFSYWIVIKGNHKGTIWYCDGDSISLQWHNNSFFSDLKIKANQ